jgi:DNA-binding transcriptional MerR regulator
MFKIGEFSKLSLVPVKTLRYYDEIDLLRPAHVDTFTGYRYYTLEQLQRLNRILALKDLGFSLEQVARLLDGALSPQDMREILAMKRAELERRVQGEQERLARVAWRLSQIEQEGSMPAHEMMIKQLEPQLVAAVRDVVPHYPDVGGLINEVYAHLAQHGVQAGLCASIYHDGEYRERDVDCEGVVYLERPVPAAGRVKVYELPATTAAVTVHHGGYSGLTEAYRELMGWIVASGYKIAGPEREIYLRGPAAKGDQNDPNCVTEIQFPVARA